MHSYQDSYNTALCDTCGYSENTCKLNQSREPYVTIHPDNGEEAFWINGAQFNALNRKFLQDPDGSPNFFEFRKRVRKGYDCLMLQWCGMWLGIEEDGYTHS